MTTVDSALEGLAPRCRCSVAADPRDRPWPGDDGEDDPGGATHRSGQRPHGENPAPSDDAHGGEAETPLPEQGAGGDTRAVPVAGSEEQFDDACSRADAIGPLDSDVFSPRPPLHVRRPGR